MDQITFIDKSTGDQVTAADINEIKSVVNEHASDKWDDVVAPILTASKSTGNPPDDVSFLGGQVYGFDLNDVCYFNFQLPHSYKEGSNINFHFHGSVESTISSEENAKVQFRFTYNWADINERFDATATTVDKEFSLTDVNSLQNLIFDVVDITGTGHKISSILICSLTRIAATSNEYANQVYISSLDLHFVKDDRGSENETSK